MTSAENICSYCPTRPCIYGDMENAPKGCPTIVHHDLLAVGRVELAHSENRRMSQNVARTWKEMGRLTRVEEIVLFANLQGYKKLGLAFCVGLADEAQLLTNFLLNEGFDVASASCMCGALSSEEVELPERDRYLVGRRQPLCNPIGQAMVLDAQGCEFSILLGLCVGDDTLFIKHSKAPVTVLSVKDRVLAHNPLGVLHIARNVGSRIDISKPQTSAGPGK